MQRLASFGAAALAAGIVLCGAACAHTTKSGGASEKRTIVLTFASDIRGGQPEQLTRFASQVAKQSNGTIQIQFRDNWRARDQHQELDTIRDVKAGKVDLAWVGARAWDWVGVHRFDALVAPLLIESYPLEQKVFADRIPERMLPALRQAGVAGIGVLPGPMRKPLGVRRRLLTPAAFRGLNFGVQGVVAAETLRALGARPRQFFSSPPLAGLGGIEEQMSAVEGNQHDAAAPFLTADLNLWPRPLVIFASEKVLDRLSSAQRAALRQAAAAAVPQAMTASEREDGAAVRTLCARGKLRVVDLEKGELQSFEGAVAPVYRRLEHDPSTRRAIHEIMALKRGLPPAPAIRCPPKKSSSPYQAGATPLDGSWQMSVTVGDLSRNPAYHAYGFAPSAADYRADAGAYRLILRNGHLEFSRTGGGSPNPHDSGTYRVDGNLITFHIAAGHDPGETWTYRWSVYRNSLTFERPPTNAQGPGNPTFAPWHRITSTKGSRGAKRGKLDGVYEADVSGNDLPENLGHFVYVFDRGRFAFTQEDARACTWQYGKLAVRGHLMTWRFIDGGATKSPNHAYNKPGEFFEFKWSRYRDTLTLSPAPGAISPTTQTAEPWHRVTTRPSSSYLSRDCPPPKAALP